MPPVFGVRIVLFVFDRGWFPTSGDDQVAIATKGVVGLVVLKFMVAFEACVKTPFLILTGCQSMSQSRSDSTNGYTLVWQDEFNRDGKPDPEKWSFEAGFNATMNFNTTNPTTPFVATAT